MAKGDVTINLRIAIHCSGCHCPLADCICSFEPVIAQMIRGGMDRTLAIVLIDSRPHITSAQWLFVVADAQGSDPLLRLDRCIMVADRTYPRIEPTQLLRRASTGDARPIQIWRVPEVGPFIFGDSSAHLREIPPATEHDIAEVLYTRDELCAGGTATITTAAAEPPPADSIEALLLKHPQTLYRSPLAADVAAWRTEAMR